MIEALRAATDFGVFGYYRGMGLFRDAVAWWLQNRHGWTIDPTWILPTQGLGNAIAMCLDVYTQPGDNVVIFSPVYHEFALKVGRAGRKVTECPLVLNGDRYELDLDDAQSRLTGNETMLIWCSPQNPSGRIWTPAELRAVADFAERNGLTLVSDEVHHDLIYPGETFVTFDNAAPQARDRLVMLCASSKTFNLAGLKVGCMVIPDETLRGRMASRMRALDYTPSSLGVIATTAAYSPQGAAWVDAQIAHLVRNRTIFDAGMAAIPGVRSLPLQSTYLAWVDFSGTGMPFAEFQQRIAQGARIAASPGPSFGAGGETFMRFNLATQGARVEEAVTRMKAAFADLQ